MELSQITVFTTETAAAACAQGPTVVAGVDTGSAFERGIALEAGVEPAAGRPRGRPVDSLHGLSTPSGGGTPKLQSQEFRLFLNASGLFRAARSRRTASARRRRDT